MKTALGIVALVLIILITIAVTWTRSFKDGIVYLLTIFCRLAVNIILQIGLKMRTAMTWASYSLVEDFLACPLVVLEVPPV